MGWYCSYVDCREADVVVLDEDEDWVQDSSLSTLSLFDFDQDQGVSLITLIDFIVIVYLVK